MRVASINDFEAIRLRLNAIESERLPPLRVSAEEPVRHNQLAVLEANNGDSHAGD